MRVTVTNISKAGVNPYYGREIPNWTALGIQPDRIYMMLRHPDELAAAADTFNNLPLLDEHLHVTADRPVSERVVGATGSNCRFNDPYLQNSIAVWPSHAIQAIASRALAQLSAAYRYVADMTPGIFRGLRYDGIMRNIVGNHVALVAEGRAGPDVMVADAKLETHAMIRSRRALVLQGALTGVLGPLLAADKSLDLTAQLEPVNAANMVTLADSLAGSIVASAAPLLAADTTLEVATVAGVIRAVAALPADADDTIAADAQVAPPTVLVLNTPAPAAPTADPAPQGITQAAMDAALQRVRAETLAESAAIRDAMRAVEPFVGEVTAAMDSAAAIYKLALDKAGVDLTGVDASAYRAMVGLLPKPGAGDPPPAAFDHASVKSAQADFAARFPTAVMPRSN